MSMPQIRPSNRLMVMVATTLAICAAAAGQTNNTAEALQLMSVSTQDLERDNAAFWYLRAMEAYADFSPDDYELVMDYADNPQGPPPAAVLAATRRATEALNFLQRGADLAHHDLHLDYSQGFELLLPHLAPMRNLARVAQADAIIRMQNGDISGATNRLASVYGLASHAGTDRVLISSLVGQAIFATGDNAVLRALDQAALGPMESAELLRALQRVNNDDPFGYVESMMMEQQIALEWIDAKLGTPEGRLNAGDVLDWMANDEASANAIADMTDEEFDASLVSYDEGMNLVVEAFLMDDPEAAKAALADIGDQVDAGEFGILAQSLMPSFLRVYVRKLEAQAMLDERIAMLEELAKGEVKPEEHANAALYYLQAIKLMDKTITPEGRVRLRAQDDDPRGAIPDMLRSDLVELEGVVALFREGASMQRCDFSQYRVRDLTALAPEYAADLRDGLRLLFVDGLRALRDDAPGEAAERVAIAFRVAGHLSTDEPLVTPLVAHQGFTQALRLADSIMKTPNTGLVEQLVLFDAVDTIPLRDPFGFIGSVIATRKTLVLKLRQRSPNLAELDRDLVTTASESWSGDHLMYLLAIVDTMARASDGDDASTEMELLALNDVLSPPDLEAARDQVSIIAPRLAAGEVDMLRGVPLPLIAEYRDAQRRARADLRNMLMRLRPSGEPEAAESMRADDSPNE